MPSDIDSGKSSVSSFSNLSVMPSYHKYTSALFVSFSKSIWLTMRTLLYVLQENLPGMPGKQPVPPARITVLYQLTSLTMSEL